MQKDLGLVVRLHPKLLRRPRQEDHTCQVQPGPLSETGSKSNKAAGDIIEWIQNLVPSKQKQKQTNAKKTP